MSNPRWFGQIAPSLDGYAVIARLQNTRNMRLMNGKEEAMSEYVKIKRRLYDELVETKAKYTVLCQMLESMQAVWEENKPKEGKVDG